MKRQMLLTVLLGLITQPLLAADVIIDDFKTGYIYQMSTQCGVDDKTVRADIPGKHRWVRLQVNPQRADCKTNAPANNHGFTVAFPLAKFNMTNGMQLIDYQDTDFLSLIIQTVDGNFAISQIKVTAQPDAAALKAEC